MIVDNLIENIENGTKLNIDYMEYVILFDDYYLTVYPFVYKLNRYIDMKFDKGSYRSYIFGTKSMVKSYHHIDYIRGLIKHNPCDVYHKMVSEQKTPEAKYYECNDNQFKMYQNHCYNVIRNLKLKRICGTN